MCGIAGIIRRGPVTAREIEELAGLVRHRGPDGFGHWVSEDQRAALGHARLSILDLSAAADQPMVSATGRYVGVFNGEVYNFFEIGKELEANGHALRTTSDTEVVLAAFERWGVAALQRFNGMWALGIYDTREHVLILARDRYGVKPLYYRHTAQEFVFASEIQAIGRFLGPQVSPNRGFLNRLVAWDLSAFGERETHLEGVHALPAGSWARIDRAGQLQTEQWYTLSRVQVPRGLEPQAEGLRELLIDACRIRLRSDVPVATCLSGGVDSGSIVSVLAKIANQGSYRTDHFSHRSFTAAFPGTSIDEAAAAESLAAANQMALDAKVIECPTPEELERAMRACDGPMPALAFYPIWKIYEHIRQSGITVTLDGQGADEMLGGYYLGYPALRAAWQAGRPLRGLDLYRTYRALSPYAADWIADDLRATWRDARAEIDQAIKQPLKRLLARSGWYTPKPSRLRQPPARPTYVSPADQDVGDWLAHALWQQFFVSPLPFLLHQYDRCSMASGVECRMPFMDYRLVEYVFSLPLDARIGGGYTKRVLREAMKGILPERTRRHRRKTGFNAPFRNWIEGPLRGWAQDLMSSRVFLENPCFVGDQLRTEFLHAGRGSSPGVDERRLWPALHLTWWEMHSGVRGR